MGYIGAVFCPNEVRGIASSDPFTVESIEGSEGDFVVRAIKFLYL